MSARNTSNHRSYRESKLLEDWEPEILTPLPLPGEYVVLQFNPVAMAKHVGSSNLIKEFKKLQTNKYVAICAGYYEAISDLKPWHMMHALLLASESEEEEELPTQDRSPDSDEETDVPPASQSGSRHVKRTKIRVVNNICVRIHTRLCDLPRTKPVEIPAEIYAQVQHRIVAGEKSRYDEHWREFGTRVPFRGFTLVQGPEPSTQENLPPAPEGTYDPAEWDTASKELQLCLLPHCDYSFDLNQETCWGSQFMDEHAKILSMLRAAIPEMPLKAVLPADYNHPDPKNYYVEERPNPTWIGMGLTQAPDFIMQKTERARRRAEQYNHRQSWFQRFFHPETMYRPTKEVADLQRQSEGIEIPSNQFLIRAPPEVADTEASPPKKRKRSWRERLADLLADLKITTSLMFWIPPAYPEPLDDEPYIPFALWDKLSKEGKITRWESNEEYLNRIRKAQQDLVLDLTEDIGI